MIHELPDPIYTRFGEVHIRSNPNEFSWSLYLNETHIGLLRGYEVSACRSKNEVAELVMRLVEDSQKSVFELLAEIEP